MGSSLRDTHREAETAVVGWSGYPNWLHGTPEMPVGTPEWCALAADKIEGLTEDLLSAVQVAYRRGAVDWTRLNYPQWFLWIASQHPGTPANGRNEREAVARLAWPAAFAAKDQQSAAARRAVTEAFERADAILAFVRTRTANSVGTDGPQSGPVVHPEQGSPQ